MIKFVFLMITQPLTDVGLKSRFRSALSCLFCFNTGPNQETMFQVYSFLELQEFSIQIHADTSSPHLFPQYPKPAFFAHPKLSNISFQKAEAVSTAPIVQCFRSNLFSPSLSLRLRDYWNTRNSVSARVSLASSGIFSPLSLSCLWPNPLSFHPEISS